MENREFSDDIARIIVQKGVVFGHKKSKTHPKMKPHIIGNRNEIELIDPASSWDSLIAAADLLKEKISSGGIILFVGTTPAAKKIVEDAAKKLKFPYVTSRWLGGTLTNFSVIRKRAQYYQSLMDRKEKGALDKYTKKEQHEFTKEIQKLSTFFDGLLSLTRVPDVLFIVDVKSHKTAVREANRLKVPIVGVTDTDSDPGPIDFPIYASDHGRGSISWVVEHIISELESATRQPAEDKE